MESRKMLATVLLVTTLFTSSVASGPSGYPGSQSYGGYNQHQQYQPQQQQQQDQWYSDASQASYQKDKRSSQEQPQAATSIAEPTTVAEDVVDPPPLPEGWSEHLDPNSGQYYYYNAADGTTSWDRPLPPDTTEQGVVVGESKGEDSQPPVSSEKISNYVSSSTSAEQELGNTGATDVTQNPTPEQQQEREHQGPRQDIVVGGNNAVTEKGEMPDSPPVIESWESNQSPQMKQPGPSEPSGNQQQQGGWGGQRQSDHPQANQWVSLEPSQQQSDSNKWGQSNSTEPSVVGGEPEARKYEYQGQPPQIQQQPPSQQEQSSGWGLPQQANNEDRPPQPVQPWGVPKSPEQAPQHPTDHRKQQLPPLPSRETQAAASDISSDQTSSDGRWGMPKATVIPPPSDRPQNTDSPHPQRQSWQEQRPAQGTQQPPEAEQRPPVQQGPPHASRPPPQQQQQPQYMQRQYPPQPYGQYNPNAPPGQSQYDPKYGGQNSYGRGYPPQQQPQSQTTSTGQLISHGTEAGTTAVKEALSTTWKGLLGFGNMTREVVGTAREQVVTGATTAGQTLSARSSSIWETAKSTVGNVFENNDSGSQPAYSLSGHSQPLPDNRPPPSYPGRPTGPNPGYPNGPGSPGGQGAPPRNIGGPQQQRGRYGPPSGQQPPRYGGSPNSRSPVRQQPPPSQQQPQQQMKPQGYPDMQPRRDPPYPQMQKGQQRGPMQSQYGNQSGSQQPPPQGGGYPNQQRPPFAGPPGPQSNRGPDIGQGPPQQKQQQPDPWDHPGLMGEH